MSSVENVRAVVGKNVPYSRAVKITNPDELAAALGGVGSAFYIHEQAAPSKVWDITHSLGVQYPRVLILDVDGVTVFASVDWNSSTPNYLRVEFFAPASGTAIISN